MEHTVGAAAQESERAAAGGACAALVPPAAAAPLAPHQDGHASMLSLIAFDGSQPANAVAAEEEKQQERHS